MTDQERIEDNQKLLADNVALIYHIMKKQGMSVIDMNSDKGQFVWEKICQYLPGYRKEKSKLGTWANWHIMAAIKAWEYKKHCNTPYNCCDPVTMEETTYDHRGRHVDFLAVETVTQAMQEAITEDARYIPHREIAMQNWTGALTQRQLARKYNVSKQRINQSLEISKQKVIQSLPRRFRKEMVHGY